MKIAKLILLWLVAIMFIATGILKLIQMDEMSLEIFGRAHYPMALFYLAGIFESAGGVLMLIKATQRWGLIMISVVMIGAITTHIYIGDHWGHTVVPVLILVFAGWMIKSEKH